MKMGLPTDKQASKQASKIASREYELKERVKNGQAYARRQSFNSNAALARAGGYQDSVLDHAAGQTQDLLEQNNPDFITKVATAS